MNRRILDAIFQEQKLDVVISLSRQTRLWLTKIDTSAGYLFIEKETATLLIDGRYFEYASKQAQNCQVLLQKGKSVQEWVAKQSYQRVGIEEDYLTIRELEYLKKLLPEANFVHISGAKLRILKTPAEAQLIATAGEIALKALNKVQSQIKAGMSEKDIDILLETEMRLAGAEKGSFDAIVASGIRGSLPHGRASNKIIQNGELITIDFGCIYQGYCSDITRTFHVGKVENPKLLEIEAILRKAQKLGIEAIKPNVAAKEIDRICREYIASQGYGDFFTHSTGHGLGIDVHEMPSVSENSLEILQPGMVITVEPGIYIPELGGIRIEDDVLVTENGYQVLSKI